MDRNQRKRLKRQLDSIIIHFDYDCFYASVFENETPALKSLPLAVQQKQIVVTCNYEARRRTLAQTIQLHSVDLFGLLLGLYKLQLIKDAKKACPDVVIVLGEDLTRFRNASKELYAFLKSFSWNSRCERLGFDEVFMDVSDIIEYNVSILNHSDLANSFFCLSKNDPTAGFAFDALTVAGHTYPETSSHPSEAPIDSLQLHLHLASHLALWIRQKLESEKGYTCTVGISTNKLLSKLVGNLHKPNGQTTLLPPYDTSSNDESVDGNVTSFLDDHEVGRIPGIGFKIAQKLRAYVLQRPAEFDTGLVYGGTKEHVTVRDVRKYPGMGPRILDQVLAGPGTSHGIGAKIWGLLNGVDDTDVGQAREVPKQISIEDSYIRLDTTNEVIKELRMLAKSLIKRMHVDLLENGEDQAVAHTTSDSPPTSKRWLAYPKTIRLSTRSRPPQNPDGSRNRSFARISRSGPMPNFIFSLQENVDAIAERLVTDTLVPLFLRLHPEKSGWNLNLVNIAATHIMDAANEKGGVGRDIGMMFKRQDDVLKQLRLEERNDLVGFEELGHREDPHVEEPSQLAVPKRHAHESGSGSEDIPTPSQELNFIPDGDDWDYEDEIMADDDTYRCEECGAAMPFFAMAAHSRWHAQN